MDLTLIEKIEELEPKRAPGVEPFMSGQWCPIGDCPHETHLTADAWDWQPCISGSLPSDDTPLIPPLRWEL